MLRPSSLLKAISAIAVAASMAGYFGYRTASVDDNFGGFAFASDWTEIPQPTDYSGSRDRIELELATLGLFGPARSATAGSTPASGLPTEDPIYLIAIADLDGVRYAIVQETAGQTQRLASGEETPSGWTLTAFRANGVVMRRGEEERIVGLFADRGQPDATPVTRQRR